MVLYDLIQPSDNRTRFNVYASNPFKTYANRKTVLIKNKKRTEIEGDVLKYIVSSYQPYDFSMDIWVCTKEDFEKYKTEWMNGIRD